LPLNATAGVCVRHSELPGTSRIFADFLYDYPRVSPFFPHDPSDLSALDRARGELRYPEARRAAVAAALRETNGPSESLALFEQPGTAAILTGQQVGLYGGPAYTLYKALTAIRIARQLTAEGKPTVPIFWLATEDHDVEEVRGALFFDREVQAQASADGRPAGRHALAGLPDELGLTPEVAALVERHYRNGRTFGEAFFGLLHELLSPLGILFADPLHPGLREAAAGFLREAALASPAMGAKLVEREAELKAAGYHAQVFFDPKQTSLFFLLEEGRRTQLKFDGATYSDGKREWTPAELAREGVKLSPNALLRPVWQDWMFPTVGLVGGPGELAYFAQSSVLYLELLGRMPVMLPRAFFTIVDAKSQSLIERYRFRYAEVLRGEEEVKAAVSQRLIPPTLLAVLAESEERVDRAFRNLDAELERFDPTLVAASANSQAKIRYQFTKNKGKIVREVFRKSEQAQAHAGHLSHRLAPHGHLQERSYSLVALLNEYGLGFPETILENIHVGCHDHHVLALG
jgi:bacillithiol biosynthesis cysteine-adding enzyme BshC